MVLASLKKWVKDTAEDKQSRTEVMQLCKQHGSAWSKQENIAHKQG